MRPTPDQQKIQALIVDHMSKCSEGCECAYDEGQEEWAFSVKSSCPEGLALVNRWTMAGKLFPKLATQGELRLAKAEAFVRDLKDLLTKHNVSLSVDCYEHLNVCVDGHWYGVCDNTGKFGED